VRDFVYAIGDIDAADLPSRIEGGRHEGVLGLFQLHPFRCRSRNLKATHIAIYACNPLGLSRSFRGSGFEG
jgi:hypothetical protein